MSTATEVAAAQAPTMTQTMALESALGFLSTAPLETMRETWTNAQGNLSLLPYGGEQWKRQQRWSMVIASIAIFKFGADAWNKAIKDNAS